MDQDTFFTIADEDLSQVNMNAAPTSGEEYLKQVVISRKSIPSVVVADMNFMMPLMQTTPTINESSSTSSRTMTPPRWWSDKQCSDFSQLRQKLRRSKARMNKNGRTPTQSLTFPNLNDEEAWRTFCFRKWNNAVAKTMSSEQIQNMKRIHKGTPPLVTVLLAMNQPRIIDALEFHVAWFVEEGYDEARMQWLFALMCVLEKPLDPDVCSTLRDLAKTCIRLRDESDNDDGQQIRCFNWFICVVANYFDQKDLVDL